MNNFSKYEDNLNLIGPILYVNRIVIGRSVEETMKFVQYL